MEWDVMGCGMAWDEMRWAGMGWDGMAGWDEMRMRRRMGWDGGMGCQPSGRLTIISCNY